MKFSEAAAKLAEISGGAYRRVQYSEVSDGQGNTFSECSIYFHNDEIYKGATWEEAFENREKKVNPKSFTPDGQPE